jgi:hypothetical protein
MLPTPFRWPRWFSKLAAAFCRDQAGEASTLSLVLIATVLALGATVGLVTFRNQVVQELGDVAVSLERLDQSFDAGPYGSYTDTIPATATDTANQPPDSIGFP